MLTKRDQQQLSEQARPDKTESRLSAIFRFTLCRHALQAFTHCTTKAGGASKTSAKVTHLHTTALHQCKAQAHHTLHCLRFSQ